MSCEPEGRFCFCMLFTEFDTRANITLDQALQVTTQRHELLSDLYYYMA